MTAESLSAARPAGMGAGPGRPARSLWVLVPLSAFGGVLTSTGFPASDLAPLALLGVAVGLGACAASGTAGRGAITGLAYGVAFAGVVFAWALQLEVLAYLALAPIQGAFWVLTGAAATVAARRLGPLGWTVAVAATWTLVEALRARAPMGGFEWGQLGLSSAEFPVREGAAIVGTLGLTGLLVAVAAALAATLQWWGEGPLRALVPLILALAATGSVAAIGAADWTEDVGSLEVAIIQVDDPCPGEYAAECPGMRQELLADHIAAVGRLDEDVDLLLWGEGVLRGATPEQAGAALHEAAGDLPAPLLAGTSSPEEPDRFYNRNVLYEPDGTVVDAYAKRHAVPFGEYVPFRNALGWIANVGDLVPTDMVSGGLPGELAVPDHAVSLGTVVSWEVTFARLVRDSAADTQALTALTTQASYEEAPVSDQLLQAARLRAAETGRGAAIAATTGRSTIIEPGGAQPAQTELYAADELVGTLELRDGATPFVRFGEWPVIALALALGLLQVLASRRRRS
ncbi:apolipoprotein N-acyltransferase [Egibacter rhizosphaerae]|uniref:Apolipoprotein N-acyltransferase n=1 Tax=Egibacter rhizosphaerae TaxID=1670831 RepID=A0A411YKI7_9ACTN|nr:apolipoprotein N-acyltransferase [Egibacter rhizosphaerae]QBI21705.1 apolipoprotein N-acyltransferase [Egibacter rhizosphaerae]